MRIWPALALLLILPALSLPLPALGKDAVTLAIMVAADPVKEAPKYEALSLYIKGKSEKIGSIKLHIARDYPDAARLFRSGEVQGMFTGSFVGAVLIKKGLARPVVRPLWPGGTSTYHALVVAKKGTPKFTGIGDFAPGPDGKRKIIAYCAIASAGEVYVRSLLPAGVHPTDRFSPLVSTSHQAALDALARGIADYAVVKNTVWDPARYPSLEVVGTDSRDNPDLALILTPDAHNRYADDLTRILVGLEKDTGEGAVRLRATFGCKGFISTSVADFFHTYWLMEKAHIDAKTFDFVF